MPDIERLLGNARALRKNMTYPERKLWYSLRDRRLAGLKFRRQVPLLEFIVDFHCAEHVLVIELDGDSHIGQFDYDQQRQEKLEKAGFRVVRFGNDEILREFDSVLAAILLACGIEP